MAILYHLFTAIQSIRQRQAQASRRRHSARTWELSRAAGEWRTASDETVLHWATARRAGVGGVYGEAQREADRRGLPWQRPRAAS
jgi:hypothetical protein